MYDCKLCGNECAQRLCPVNTPEFVVTFQSVNWAWLTECDTEFYVDASTKEEALASIKSGYPEMYAEYSDSDDGSCWISVYTEQERIEIRDRNSNNPYF